MLMLLYALIGLALAVTEEKCTPREEPIDVMFVVDGSSSITDEFWGNQQFFLSLLIKEGLKIPGDRAGMVQFAGKGKLPITHFEYHDSLDYQVDEVFNTEQIKGGTATDLGIDLGLTVMKRQPPVDPPNEKLMVLLTDGVPNPEDRNPCVKDTFDVRNRIKEDGVHFVILAVGVTKEEIKLIDCLVEDPEENIVIMSGFTSFYEFEDPTGDLNVFCVDTDDFRDLPTNKPTSPGRLPKVTDEPTMEETPMPTMEETQMPTDNPTDEPTTQMPTGEPTEEPTTPKPTVLPSFSPTFSPSSSPTESDMPTPAPTFDPSFEPTDEPTPMPSDEPTPMPSEEPTTPEPSNYPTYPPIETPEPTIKKECMNYDIPRPKILPCEKDGANPCEKDREEMKMKCKQCNTGKKKAAKKKCLAMDGCMWKQGECTYNDNVDPCGPCAKHAAPTTVKSQMPWGGTQSPDYWYNCISRWCMKYTWMGGIEQCHYKPEYGCGCESFDKDECHNQADCCYSEKNGCEELVECPRLNFDQCLANSDRCSPCGEGGCGYKCQMGPGQNLSGFQSLELDHNCQCKVTQMF